jgi:hypothetical protein
MHILRSPTGMLTGRAASIRHHHSVPAGISSRSHPVGSQRCRPHHVSVATRASSAGTQQSRDWQPSRRACIIAAAAAAAAAAATACNFERCRSQTGAPRDATTLAGCAGRRTAPAGRAKGGHRPTRQPRAFLLASCTDAPVFGRFTYATMLCHAVPCSFCGVF